MNKILDFIKNLFNRFKSFLKAKFTILKKWFKRNQEKIPEIIYKIVTFIIILFITFSIGTCVGSSSKDIDTAYADEVYYDGDYMTLDIGNANFISLDFYDNYTILPSIRSLFLGINSAQNNGFDFYFPIWLNETASNVIFDYYYVNIPFVTSVGNTYRYNYVFNETDSSVVYYSFMDGINNSKLRYIEVPPLSVTFELYNTSNLFNLSKTFSIRSYVFISNNYTLVNYFGFYDNLNNLLGVLYFETQFYDSDYVTDLVYGSNLYTSNNVPIFNFKTINDYAYQEGYDSGYNIGYNEGINVGGDVSYQQGYDDGYREGHIDGEQAGYDEGYGQGYFDGSEGPLKIFETIRTGFTRLLKIEIFPNFTIGSIFLLMLSISLLFFVVRVFIK